VTLNVLDVLKRVPGTTNVQIFGAKDYAMRIWLQARPPRAAPLTNIDVARANEQNAQFAAGKIGQSPTGGPQDWSTPSHQGRLEDVRSSRRSSSAPTPTARRCA
jgi:multidrug efflux pump subunit AcrB